MKLVSTLSFLLFFTQCTSTDKKRVFRESDNLTWQVVIISKAGKKASLALSNQKITLWRDFECEVWKEFYKEPKEEELYKVLYCKNKTDKTRILSTRCNTKTKKKKYIRFLGNEPPNSNRSIYLDCSL